MFSEEFQMQIFNQDISNIISTLIIFLCIFIFTLLGSYMREMWYIVKMRYRKVKINRMMFTTVTFSVTLFLTSDKWFLKSLDTKSLLFLSFCLGAGGYSFIDAFFDGRLLKIIGKSMFKIKDDIIESVNEVSKEEEEKNKEKKEK